MATNYNQDREFGSRFLEEIIEYIGENFQPEDVFPEGKLKEWGATQEPENIFDEAVLSKWADDNGYAKD